MLDTEVLFWNEEKVRGTYTVENPFHESVINLKCFI
jgi:hypothetical protein